MSKNRRFLVSLVIVGVMFFRISSNAMESGKEGTRGEKTDGYKIIAKSNKKESEIKDEKGIEEDLKNLGYGETKEDQIETKEWIESYGFDNEDVYKRMKTNMFKDLGKCLESLIEEQIKKFNDVTKEFENISFNYLEQPVELGYYDDFYGEYDNYEPFKVDEEELEKVLKLMDEKKISREIVVNYIKNVLPCDKKTRLKIKNYKELIRKAYEEYVDGFMDEKDIKKANKYKELLKVGAYNMYVHEPKFRVASFVLNKGNEDEEGEKCYIYNSNSIDMLKKEFEEMKRNQQDLKVLINSDKEESDDDILKDNKIDNKDNENIKWARNWVDMWGGSLEELYKKNKLVKIEDIKKHLKKTVIKDVNTFNEAISRFKKYKIKFDDFDFNDDINKNLSVEELFNFKELKEIIEKENKELEKKYGILIDERIITDYVKKVLYSRKLKRGIKNYCHLIKRAYELYINHCIESDRYSDLKLNSYKLYDIDELDRSVKKMKEKKTIIFDKNKKRGKVEIYRKDAVDKLKSEYDEMENILKIRSILERMKKKDKGQLYAECCSILSNNMMSLNSNINTLKDIFEKYINKKEEDYFKFFIKYIKQAIEEVEDQFNEFIDISIELTKEEYYPNRFFDKFKRLIKDRSKLIYYVENMNSSLKEELKNSDEIKQFYKLKEIGRHKLGDKLCKYLRKDFALINKKNMGGGFLDLKLFDHFYISAIIRLSDLKKLTFFERLEELLENFEKIEKARDIMLFLEYLEGIGKYKELPEKDIDSLINKIGDKIGEERIEELKSLFKFKKANSYGAEYIKRIRKSLEKFWENWLLSFNENRFFKELEKSIRNAYNEETFLDGIKETLDNFLKDMKSKENSANKNSEIELIKEKWLREILKRLECYVEIAQDIKEDIKYIFKNLMYGELKQFILRLLKIDYFDAEKFIHQFLGLIRNKSDEIKMSFLKKEIKEIVNSPGVDIYNFEAFKQTQQYETLEQKCKRLYMLQNKIDLDFLESIRINISLKRNVVDCCNEVNVTFIGYDYDSVRDDYYDYYNGPETRQGTEI